MSMKIELTGIIIMLFAVCMFVAVSMLVGAVTLYVQGVRDARTLERFRIAAEVACSINPIYMNIKHLDWGVVGTTRPEIKKATRAYPCGHRCKAEHYMPTGGNCPKCEMDADLKADGYLWAEDLLPA